MAIQTTHTAFNAGSYQSRSMGNADGWVPRFDEPEQVTIPSMRNLAAVASPVVNSLAELVQPELLQPQDTVTLSSPAIDTDDDELRGVFAEMASDRNHRVAARAQMAQEVQEDWTKTQEEVRNNEQMRQTNMSNMWRQTFNPMGGMMPMPMPMSPMPSQLGMQVSGPMQPGMMQPGMMQPGMQPGMMQPGMMPGAYPSAPGMPMTGTYSAYPSAPGTPYPAPPGTVSPAMASAPPYYYR